MKNRNGSYASVSIINKLTYYRTANTMYLIPAFATLTPLTFISNLGRSRTTWMSWCSVIMTSPDTCRSDLQLSGASRCSANLVRTAIPTLCREPFMPGFPSPTTWNKIAIHNVTQLYICTYLGFHPRNTPPISGTPILLNSYRTQKVNWLNNLVSHIYSKKH